MSKKFAGLLLLAALAMSVVGQRADATLFSLPKSLKSLPLDGLEMSLPIWGPSARSFFCVENLSACQLQPEKVSLFSLPMALKQQLHGVTHDMPIFFGPVATHTLFC